MNRGVGKGLPARYEDDEGSSAKRRHFAALRSHRVLSTCSGVDLGRYGANRGKRMG